MPHSTHVAHCPKCSDEFTLTFLDEPLPKHKSGLVVCAGSGKPVPKETKHGRSSTPVTEEKKLIVAE